MAEYEILSRSLMQMTNEAIYAFTTAIDRKRRAAQTQFELLVKETKDYAIFMIDPNGIILSWNEGAKRIKQYEEKEVNKALASGFNTHMSKPIDSKKLLSLIIDYLISRDIVH